MIPPSHFSIFSLWKQYMKLIALIHIHVAEQNVSHRILFYCPLHFTKRLKRISLIFKQQIALGRGPSGYRRLELLEIIHLLHPGIINSPQTAETDIFF